MERQSRNRITKEQVKKLAKKARPAIAGAGAALVAGIGGFIIGRNRPPVAETPPAAPAAEAPPAAPAAEAPPAAPAAPTPAEAANNTEAFLLDMTRRIRRREILRYVGLGVAATGFCAAGALTQHLIESLGAPTTATPKPTDAPTVTPEPTKAPTKAPEPTKAPTVARIENQVSQSLFTITGVPNSVSKDELVKWTDRSPEQGDVPHTNTIGLGTQAFLAEPGVLTVADLENKITNTSAWSSLRSDVQKVFEENGPAFWGIPEGGFVMLTGAYMKLTFKGANGKDITVNLNEQQNHAWFVVIRGLDQDKTTPNDNNLQLTVDQYNPGYTMATRLPQGQYVSEDYFKQNVETANKKNCGSDGCQKVSVMFIDRDGAYTVIRKNKSEEDWRLVKTNIILK